MALSKNKRIWIFVLVLLVISVLFAYQYIYQDHRNIQSEKAEYTTTSKIISEEFKLNALNSEKKYLNKTIEIKGTITDINKNNLTLDDKIFCQFDEIINQSIKINSVIKIKGRCIGYDDLLEQVKLDQNTVLK